VPRNGLRKIGLEIKMTKKEKTKKQKKTEENKEKWKDFTNVLLVEIYIAYACPFVFNLQACQTFDSVHIKLSIANARFLHMALHNSESPYIHQSSLNLSKAS